MNFKNLFKNIVKFILNIFKYFFLLLGKLVDWLTKPEHYKNNKKRRNKKVKKGSYKIVTPKTDFNLISGNRKNNKLGFDWITGDKL